MKKRGQFYIIAAFVIVGLLIGFVSVSNYSKKSGDVKIYDIKEELGIESEQVLEVGIYSEQESSLEELLTLFSEDITKYYNDESRDIYLVYGNPENGIKFITLQEINKGSITISSGSNQIGVPANQQEYIRTDIPTENIQDKNVQVDINGNPYQFNLQEGENFYFIITEITAGGNYSETNQLQ